MDEGLVKFYKRTGRFYERAMKLCYSKAKGGAVYVRIRISGIGVDFSDRTGRIRAGKAAVCRRRIGQELREFKTAVRDGEETKKRHLLTLFMRQKRAMHNIAV